mgnify:CR=1 FL=1
MDESYNTRLNTLEHKFSKMEKIVNDIVLSSKILGILMIVLVVVYFIYKRNKLYMKQFQEKYEKQQSNVPNPNYSTRNNVFDMMDV